MTRSCVALVRQQRKQWLGSGRRRPGRLSVAVVVVRQRCVLVFQLVVIVSACILLGRPAGSWRTRRMQTVTAGSVQRQRLRMTRISLPSWRRSSVTSARSLGTTLPNAQRRDYLVVAVWCGFVHLGLGLLQRGFDCACRCQGALPRNLCVLTVVRELPNPWSR